MLNDGTVDRIVLRAGTYELTSDYSQSGCSDSALCINRAVTIEAEMPGSVVLDAKKNRRVFYIQLGGAAELIGLNITGGKSYSVTCPRFEPSLTFPPAPLWYAHCWRCVLAGLREFCAESNPRM